VPNIHYQEALARRNKKIRARRLVESRAKGTHTVTQWNELKAEFGWRCVRCGCIPDGLCKDHIIPIYRGGSDGIDNIQPVCRPCNSSKGAEVSNWVAWRRQHGWGGANA
jgi:5-methylcytosine-specific restriction endonuclease McrA